MAMTRDDRALSHEILARLELDSLFKERVQYHLTAAREELKAALDDISISPEAIDDLDYKVRTYGKLLDVILKMSNNIIEKSKEDAFAEANVTAQEKETAKYE